MHRELLNVTARGKYGQVYMARYAGLLPGVKADVRSLLLAQMITDAHR